MPGRIIPKDKLSSYRCWEPEAFERQEPPLSNDGHCQQCEAAEEEARWEEGTGEESNNQHHGAIPPEDYGRGYDAGRKAGYEAGYEAGCEEGRNFSYRAGYEAGAALAADQANRLEALLQEFQRELSTADQVISQDLLSLALGLAKQMTREALRVKPELVCAVVRECLRQEHAFNQPAQLFLNPEDAVLVRKYLDQELDGWVICIDSQLERGGCRIKVGHSETDATAGTRWQRITQALGQSSAWME